MSRIQTDLKKITPTDEKRPTDKNNKGNVILEESFFNTR